MGACGDPVVVLGYGAAAVNALFALRENGYAGPIVVISDTDFAPYSPVLTSYYAAGLISKDQCHPWSREDLDALDFELLGNAVIERLDAQTHEVLLADGRSISFSACLIATGAHPVAPGFPVGAALGAGATLGSAGAADPAASAASAFEPLFLRTMDDAERLKSVLEDGSMRELLISGTSMVALKALEACLCRGKRVTLLGRSAHILRGSAHPQLARRFEELLAGLGVTMRLSDAIDHIVDSRAVRGAGVEVAFASDGSTRHFDQVIVAQGVAPNIGFVDADQIAIDRGILVDRFMRTSNPNVYAAGDVAQALDLSTSTRRVIALWANAVAQGRAAGRAIAASLRAEGDAPLPPRPYIGGIPCNTIHVASILFASAGSVAEGEGTRIEVGQRGDVLSVSAFQRNARGEDELVGFNMLATVDGPVMEDSLLNEIGCMRREIMSRYLRDGGE